MSGPILLVIIGVAFFLSYKYWEHLKKAASVVGKAINNGTSTGNSSDTNKQGWFKKNLWTILFILAGIAILFYGIISSWKIPDLASLGRWSWSHWFWILIFGGIAYALIRINDAKSSKTTVTETLKSLLIGAMIFLFIGASVIGWFANIGKNTDKTSHHQHLVEKTTLSIVMPANGDSPHVSAPVGYAPAFTGNKFTTHYVYSDGTKGTVGDPTSPHHNGHILYYYVHDTSGKPNSVTYEFVKPK